MTTTRLTGGAFKGALVERNGRNPKVHGSIPGVPVGATFEDRIACSSAAVHAPLRGGISGNQEDGAYSVVLSGGYEDDIDNGDTIIYTGQGGRDTSMAWEGRQNADQTWDRGNKALKISSVTKKPIRVVRGHSLKSQYAPAEGYRYDGLYEVVKAWRATGQTGFMTCRFEFKRLPGQPPIPGTVPKSHGANVEADSPIPDSGSSSSSNHNSSPPITPPKPKTSRPYISGSRFPQSKSVPARRPRSNPSMAQTVIVKKQLSSFNISRQTAPRRGGPSYRTSVTPLVMVKTEHPPLRPASSSSLSRSYTTEMSRELSDYDNDSDSDSDMNRGPPNKKPKRLSDGATAGQALQQSTKRGKWATTKGKPMYPNIKFNKK